MDLDTLVVIAMLASGAFTLALGIVHVFMPILFDFRQAIPAEGEPLKPVAARPDSLPHPAL